MKIKVFLAEDQTLVRTELRTMLEASTLEVVGEAGNGRDAVKQVKALGADDLHVLIMDMALPYLNGLEATRQLKQHNAGLRVVLLAMHLGHYVAEAIHAGANACVYKDDLHEELVAAVKATLEGRTYLSRKISELALEDYVRRALEDNHPGELHKLTSREKEILRLIAEGKSSTEIARDLHISSHTVDTHRRHIMEKLDMHSLAALVKFAIRHGLTSLD